MKCMKMSNNAFERTGNIVGRVCPRHSGGGRPLNSVVVQPRRIVIANLRRALNQVCPRRSAKFSDCSGYTKQHPEAVRAQEEREPMRYAVVIEKAQHNYSAY